MELRAIGWWTGEVGEKWEEVEGSRWVLKERRWREQPVVERWQPGEGRWSGGRWGEWTPSEETQRRSRTEGGELPLRGTKARPWVLWYVSVLWAHGMVWEGQGGVGHGGTPGEVGTSSVYLGGRGPLRDDRRGTEGQWNPLATLRHYCEIH